MPIDGYFITPFGIDGTRATVPDDPQPDNSVNYDEGYTLPYQLDPGSDPDALDIERDKFNQLMYDITSAIQYYQQNTIAPFITSAMNGGSPYSYAKYALVFYGGIAYQSQIAANTDTPPTINWKPVDFRLRLTGNTSFYVATTGNNSNPGTVGLPWLTIQHAIDYLLDNVDLAGFVATINVADGTYTDPVIVDAPFTGGGSVQLIGNTTTPANCIISTTSANAIAASNGAYISVGGFKLQTTTSGHGIQAFSGGHVIISGNMNFGTVAAAYRHVDLSNLAQVDFNANYTISGNAQCHIGMLQNSVVNLNGSITVTLTGTPAFSSQFVNANGLCFVYAVGITFTGAATGSRYNVAQNGVINTDGGGANYFPGNSVGTSSTGGQYV